MSQGQKILEHLKKGHSLTMLDALKLFGSMKLDTRVSELRADGHHIVGDKIQLENGKRVTRYRLGEPGEQMAFHL